MGLRAVLRGCGGARHRLMFAWCSAGAFFRILYLAEKRKGIESSRRERRATASTLSPLSVSGSASGGWWRARIQAGWSSSPTSSPSILYPFRWVISTEYMTVGLYVEQPLKGPSEWIIPRAGPRDAGSESTPHHTTHKTENGKGGFRKKPGKGVSV